MNNGGGIASGNRGCWVEGDKEGKNQDNYNNIINKVFKRMNM